MVDTTEITCEGHRNRLQSKQGLGPISDNKTLGYYLQPILCLDQSSGLPLGIAGTHIWNRTTDLLTDYKQRYITERESDKWYTPVMHARDSVLSKAERITYVMDREADIYEVLEAIPDNRTHIVIRSRHDRFVMHNHTKIHVGNFLARQPEKGTFCITLQSHKRRGQKIEVAIRYGHVDIPKAKNNKYLPQTRDVIEMWVVEVEEKGISDEKVYWRLWTTIPVYSLEKAKEIVDIYKSRWQIEELFRQMKTESFDIESSELEKPENLFKLGILVMEASLKIAQLKAVRTKESVIKADAVFTSSEIECLTAIDYDLKGTTAKQSNPFNSQSLSWASWIIARLGGWKGYQSQRPPGSITYKRGLERFSDLYEGYQIAKDVYKR